MKVLDRIVLAFVMVWAALSPTAAQRGNPKVTYVIPPADIKTAPEVFRKGDNVTFSASFVAPEKCMDAGLVIKLYAVNDNSGEPTWETPSLALLKSPYDYSASAGTKTQTTFEPGNIPASAGSKLYAVVWNTCTVRIPKGIDPTTGKIIWDQRTAGFSMGGATFKLECTGGKTTSVCAYRKE